MPHRRGKPSPGEVVVAKITKLNPNSAFAELLEYPGNEGMIHISEVARGWVRDIRQFVKQGQEIVAVVFRSQPLELSIKRVSDKQAAQKTKEYNMDKRAEKMLENIAKSLGKTLEDAYNEVGYALQERFGSLYAAFKESMTNPQKVRAVAKSPWFEKIEETAQKEIGLKEFEFRAHLFLKSSDENGIEKIKAALAAVQAKGLDVHYLAAPRYLIRYTTKDPKRGQRELEEKLENIVAENKILEARFEILSA